MDDEVPFSSFYTWLDLLYQHSVNGGAGLDSAQQLADIYLQHFPDKVTSASNLILWESTKAATSGFITGLGGAITLPVSIPLNISSILFLQFRMIAAVAIIGGHSVNDPTTRNLIYLCLGGNIAKDILKELCTRRVISALSDSTARHIQQQVTTQLVTRLTTQFTGGITRFIPLIGGVISGGFDYLSTWTVGQLARTIFISD
ncbi:EcsC family protein [Yersinia intermedia]|uniref:EcsC family protein n=1 Tax=Yersinia intermedia TaxID=631 RepID=UPI0030CB0D01